jgi:hypothetical protein
MSAIHVDEEHIWKRMLPIKPSKDFWRCEPLWKKKNFTTTSLDNTESADGGSR